MSSVLPGYEYDTFLSYRQKDHKGDRWVSEFVEALKTEIESTFKEDVSVMKVMPRLTSFHRMKLISPCRTGFTNINL